MRSGEYQPRETASGPRDGRASAQPSRITLENNEKIRPRPDGENAFAGASGGEDGIRTHETLLTPTPLAGERLRPLGHLSDGFRLRGMLPQIKGFLVPVDELAASGIHAREVPVGGRA